MKSAFINFTLFVFLTVALSALTSCGSKVNSENAPNNNDNAAASPLPDTARKIPEDSKNSEYPPAPSIVMQTDIKALDGTTYRVEDRKGQVVLLNLWATWCGPCRAEMPELVELQNKYNDKNFKILGLNTDDESPEAVKAFAAKMKLNYEIGWIDQKMSRELFRFAQFSAIPQSFLIDREGRIRGVFVGGGADVIGKVKTTVEKVVNE